MSEMRWQLHHDADDLATVLQSVEDALARDSRIHPRLRGEAILVCEELLCNALQHSQPSPGVPARTDLSIQHQAPALYLEFRDTGAAFDPLARDTPDVHAALDTRPIGGLGLHLVRELADQVDYVREEGYNVLRVVLRGPAISQEG